MSAWIPALIPSARKGWWKPVRDANSGEIEHAISGEERQAREYTAGGNHTLARLHWKRWVGLHFAYVRALARELSPSAVAAGQQDRQPK